MAGAKSEDEPGRLINDASDLADRQIELAKQEIGEAKDEAIRVVLRLAIGAGIVVAAAFLLVIWAWTARSCRKI